MKHIHRAHKITGFFFQHAPSIIDVTRSKTHLTNLSVSWFTKSNISCQFCATLPDLQREQKPISRPGVGSPGEEGWRFQPAAGTTQPRSLFDLFQVTDPGSRWCSPVGFVTVSRHSAFGTQHPPPQKPHHTHTHPHTHPTPGGPPASLAAPPHTPTPPRRQVIRYLPDSPQKHGDQWRRGGRGVPHNRPPPQTPVLWVTKRASAEPFSNRPTPHPPTPLTAAQNFPCAPHNTTPPFPRAPRPLPRGDR